MKPINKDELYLRQKFAEEDERNYVVERDARIARRVWKRATHKLYRADGKKQINVQLYGNEE